MVNFENNFRINLTTDWGEDEVRALECFQGEKSFPCPERGEVTYKRVVINLPTVNTDGFSIDPDAIETTIALSPLRAVALVGRLLEVLTELQGSGVEIPLVHSSFTRALVENQFNGTPLSDEFRSLSNFFTESARVRDGMQLVDILPPSLT